MRKAAAAELTRPEPIWKVLATRMHTGDQALTLAETEEERVAAEAYKERRGRMTTSVSKGWWLVY